MIGAETAELKSERDTINREPRIHDFRTTAVFATSQHRHQNSIPSLLFPVNVAFQKDDASLFDHLSVVPNEDFHSCVDITKLKGLANEVLVDFIDQLGPQYTTPFTDP